MLSNCFCWLKRNQSTLVGIPEALNGDGKGESRNQTVFGISDAYGSAEGGGGDVGGGKSIRERIKYLQENDQEKYTLLLKRAFVSQLKEIILFIFAMNQAS